MNPSDITPNYIIKNIGYEHDYNLTFKFLVKILVQVNRIYTIELINVSYSVNTT